MKKALLSAAILLLVGTLGAKDHSAEYKAGKLGEKSTLSTGSSCTTAENTWGDLHTHCGATAIKTYEVISDEGFIYLVEPDTYDPFAAMVTGDAIQFRIDGTNTDRLWTPDPKHAQCPWPCTGKQKEELKQGLVTGHDAKQWLNSLASVDSRKTLPCLDLIEYGPGEQTLLKNTIGSTD